MQPRSNRAVRRHLTQLAALVAATSLVASACGGGSNDAEADDGSAKGSCPTGDPFAPAPLDEEASLTVNLPARIDIFGALLLADALGEFEKENISVEILTLPSADAAPQVASGDIDVMGRGLDAGAFNALDAGLEMRFVYPNGYPSPDDKSGWWFSSEIAAQGPEALEGAVLASAVGVGSPVVLPLLDHLEDGGLTLEDVEFQVVPTPDLPWRSRTALSTAPTCPRRSGRTWTAPGSRSSRSRWSPPTGGYIFGPQLLGEDREVGQAFLRALARTERDHLQGDYLENTEVREALAEGMELDAADLAQMPAAQFDPAPDMEWGAVLEELQTAWLEVGDVLTYDEAIGYDEVVDPSFAACIHGDGA
ncbi:hypothetical protein [Nocardioides sp. TF02-7]|uniref:ABC transporter substrate-binding protein n=1 Tax=Nocardioides sp. TF02-7 TaxID=2917724 RepID=UPI001F055C93|nr:hypothetical protein [Nocardioides sp. TF02-7]UMG93720.1 hypothetical protein MF408_05960 [Nocardioides sp. TF02-7]